MARPRLRRLREVAIQRSWFGLSTTSWSAFALVGLSALAAVGSPAAASELLVDLELSKGTTIETVDSIAVRAEPLSENRSEGSGIESFDVVVSPELTTSLSLDPAVAWRLTLVSELLWAPDAIVPVQDRPERVVLRVVSAGRITGQVRPPRDQTPPVVLELQISEVPETSTLGTSRTGGGVATILRCPVSDRTFSCQLPAGRLDLRFGAPGHAPVYRWDVRVPVLEPLDLGVLELVPGASVSGFVLTDAGEPPPAGTKVTLLPALTRTEVIPELAERVEGRAVRGTTDERGFFQLTGVGEGTHDLRVEAEAVSTDTLRDRRFGPGEIRGLLVEGAEVVLSEPVVLPELQALEVVLDPPVDPYGAPWEVELLVFESGHQFAAVPAPDAADTAGRWRATGLEEGLYRLRIGTELDPRWHFEEVVLRGDTSGAETTLWIDLPAVAVVGEITGGEGEPLRGATLWFGGRHGRKSIRMDSDTDGIFRGYLPREGEWPIDLVHRTGDAAPWRQVLDPVDVELGPGQREVELRIELPNTRLAGRVIDAAERPVPGALVMVTSPQRKSIESQLATDGEGRFELEGLRPGELLLEARSGERSSGWVRVGLAEAMEPPEVVLSLEEHRTVEGVVRSPAGPVPGAVIQASPSSATPSVPRRGLTATTRVDGTFRLDVPARTRALDLLVMARGAAVRLLRLPLGGEPPSGTGGQPVEIVLESAGAGGLLVLEISDEALATAVLDHGGVGMSPLLLGEWSRAAAGDVGRLDPGLLTLPAMEAGEYRLCAHLRSDPEEEPAHRCTSGFLPIQGELSLSLPETSDLTTEGDDR